MFTALFPSAVKRASRIASAMQGDDGAIRTYAIWPGSGTASLPRVDYVMFMASGPDGMPSHLAAVAAWDEVDQLAGDLMTAEDCYPARFRVHDFPSSDVLASLGIADWVGKK